MWEVPLQFTPYTQFRTHLTQWQWEQLSEQEQRELFYRKRASTAEPAGQDNGGVARRQNAPPFKITLMPPEELAALPTFRGLQSM